METESWKRQRKKEEVKGCFKKEKFQETIVIKLIVTQKEKKKKDKSEREGGEPHLDCARQYSNQCWSTNRICSNKRKPIKALVLKDSVH